LLNYEATASQTITARVTDQAGLSFDKAFTIGVTNVNEAPTALTLTGSTVAPGSAAGVVVGTLKGTDPDAGAVLSYSLTSDGGGRFVVDAATGAIKVKAGAVFDPAVTPTLGIVARTTDQSGLFFNQSFTITVTGNRAPNALTLTGATVAENSAAGVVVGTLKGTDPDAGATLTYSLVGDAGGRFAVNATTGVVTVKAAGLLDYEAAASQTITARVTDQAGLSFDMAFTIGVTNVKGAAINGTAGDDGLSGTREDEVITGLAGNDWLTGSGAADTLDGGEGWDVADYSNSTAAVVLNRINPALGSGAAKGNVLIGIDRVILSNFNDLYLGNAEGQFVTAGAGNDTILGGLGSDIIIGGAGADSIDGGGGYDFVGFEGIASAIVVDRTTPSNSKGDALGDLYSNIEFFDLPQWNDAFTGNSDNEKVAGNAGNDTLRGMGGDDVLVGGDGDDVLDGGLGNDVLTGEAGADTLTGGAGADRFIYTDAGFGRDTITDFQGGSGVGDVLEFSTSMFASWSALLAKTRQAGADTVITLTANDTVTLKNFSLPTFNQDDARFV